MRKWVGVRERMVERWLMGGMKEWAGEHSVIVLCPPHRLLFPTVLNLRVGAERGGGESSGLNDVICSPAPST
eukprot:3697419-Rhodomonas_salina.2